MLKQALQRGCLSYCICVTVADFAALIVVLCGGQSTVPGFVTRAGGEIVAAFLQPLLIGWIGFAFAAGSVLFEIERWSFLQQGLAHLAVTLPVFIAVEFLCFGLSNVPALLSFAASAALSYAVTWFVQYLVWRGKVHRLDEEIRRRNAGGHEEAGDR